VKTQPSFKCRETMHEYIEATFYTMIIYMHTYTPHKALSKRPGTDKGFPRNAVASHKTVHNNTAVACETDVELVERQRFS
jgi:hypothetical protein